MQASRLPQFRVATFGNHGRGSSKLPFAQYSFHHQWGEETLEEVWKDFAGNERGIIFTIMDPSRMTWFATPSMGGPMEKFLRSAPFKRVGYFPVDSFGVSGKFTGQIRDVLNGYDTVLAYTIFGKQVIEATIGKEVDWIPHGFNELVFQPRDRAAGRLALRIPASDALVGMVATNQSRKDWGAAIGAIAYLKNDLPNLKFWIHTDVPIRYWNIPALIDDFGLAESVVLTLTGEYSSDQLSYFYSACNATLLVSSEGFGFPLVESMACGVPVVHGNWGGGAELIPSESWLCPPSWDRLDGMCNMIRPCFDPRNIAIRLRDVIKENEDDQLKEMCLSSVEHLRWTNLWPSVWEKKFIELAGVAA